MEYLSEKNVTFSVRMIAFLFTIVFLSLILVLAKKTWNHSFLEENENKNLKKETNNTTRQERGKGMFYLQDNDKRSIIIVCVLTIMLFAWPLVFDSLIGLYKLRISLPLIIGFLITFIFQMFDIAYWLKFRSDQSLNKRFEDGNLQPDAQLVTTLAFAMGTLLFREPAETVETSIKISIPPIKLGLLLALTFIVPNPLAGDKSLAGFGLRAFQKSLLNFAIGFVTVGVTSDLNLKF